MYHNFQNPVSPINHTECIATTDLLDDVVDDGLAPPPADPWQRVAARRLADERGRGALPHRRRPLPERLPRRPAHDARPPRRDDEVELDPGVQFNRHYELWARNWA